MAELNRSNCPDWSAIFAERPDLEAPGYQEALKSVRDQKNRAEIERIKAQMQEIQKQKVSSKNKNRTQNKKRSALSNGQ